MDAPRTPMKQPSAWLPIAMSLAALAVVVGHIATVGAARELDEGAAAHVWQLLMAMQVPVVAFFVVKWLRRAPRQALQVFVLQSAGSCCSNFTGVVLQALSGVRSNPSFEPTATGRPASAAQLQR